MVVKPLPRVVTFARVSTKGQHDRDTLANQRAALARMQEREPGVIIAHVEHDDAISGALGLEDRPDLQQLEVLAAEGFDKLRVFDRTRLTRHADPVEWFLIFRLVKQAGAVIEDAQGNVVDPSTEAGLLQWFFSSKASADERKSILARTMAGKLLAAREGRWFGQPLPYGISWDKAQERFVVDPAKAAEIRQWFADYVAGKSMRQLTGSVDTTRMRRQLSCRAFATGELQVNILGETIPYKGAFPPIVDKTLFERVQGIIKRRSAGGGRRPLERNAALLRGLAFCSCGASIHTHHDGVRFYYACSAGGRHERHGRKKCGAPFWPVPTTDERVAEALADRQLLAAAVRQPEKSATSWERDVARCGKELKRLTREEVQLIRAKGKHSQAAYDLALGELRREQQQCEQKRQEAEERAQNAAVVADVEESLLAMRWVLTGVLSATFEERRKLIETLVPAAHPYGIFLQRDGTAKVRGVIDTQVTGGRPGGRSRTASPQCSGSPTSSLRSSASRMA